jgi:predicted nucleotidyltransferase
LPSAADTAVPTLPINPAQHHPAADAAAERLRELAEQNLPHARLWIFGSRAKGTYFRRSDFDVAVEPMNGFTNQEYSGWLDALEADTRIIYPVDTHRMDDIPAEWVERIKTEGVLWKN